MRIESIIRYIGETGNRKNKKNFPVRAITILILIINNKIIINLNHGKIL